METEVSRVTKYISVKEADVAKQTNNALKVKITATQFDVLD